MANHAADSADSSWRVRSHDFAFVRHDVTRTSPEPVADSWVDEDQWQAGFPGRWGERSDYWQRGF
jgi:hypothetical protein